MLLASKTTRSGHESQPKLIHTLQKYLIPLDSTVTISLILIYSAFISLGFYVMTPYTSLVFAIFFGMICYPFLRKNRVNKKHAKRFSVHPAIVLLFLMPLSFVMALALQPTEQGNSAFLPLQVLVTYGYSISLLSLLILIPMALLSKANQKTSNSFHKNYNPSLSIIIPAHNEEKVIERTIKSVLESNYPRKEIIIVNNASTDNTLQILKKYADKIRIADESQKGKAFAINSGIKISSGEIIVIMDADTIVTKNAFRSIVQPFYNNPKMGAVTGNVKILNYDYNYHTKIQVLEYALAFQIAKAALASQEAVTIVSGAFGAFHRKVIVAKSPFSEDTLTEDLDATITILKQGYSTTMQNDAIAYTEAPTSLSDLIKQRTRWYRGLFQGYQKHPEMLTNVSFGTMPSLIYFLMFNSSLVVPIIGIINMAMVIPAFLLGFGTLAIQIILLNVATMCGLFILSLHLNGDSLRHLKQFPVAFAYLRIHDFIFIKAMLGHAFRRKSSWNHLKRTGDDTFEK